MFAAKQPQQRRSNSSKLFFVRRNNLRSKVSFEENTPSGGSHGTQKSTNLPRAPHTPLISVRRSPRHQHTTPERLQAPPQDPPAASTHGTPEPTSHPQGHPAPPNPAKPAQGYPYIDVDAQDPGSPPRHAPPAPEQPPLKPTTIRDPDFLRATLQGRSLNTPLGWYCLQESWTKLTVKVLQDLATPSNGLHEAIVDVVLWRARQHAQGQHIWIPLIEWGQALTHEPKPTSYVEGPHAYDEPQRRRTTQQTRTAQNNGNRSAPTRDTTLRAASLRTADNDLPRQPTESDHPPPEVWCTVLERGHYYVVAATATSSGPQWLVKGTDTMLAPGPAPPKAVGDPTTQHKVLRCVLQPSDTPLARALAQITSGRASYHLGLAMFCLTQWIKRRWPSRRTVPWIWDIPTAHIQIQPGPDTRKPPPPRPQHSLTCGYHAIHRILCRVGLSPEVAYPLLTTDQEVHQICTLICEVLAAAPPNRPAYNRPHRRAAASGNIHRHNTSPHTIPAPAPARFPSGGPHTPTITRSPRPRDTALPDPPKQLHTPGTDFPCRTPLTIPHTR